MNDVSQHPDRLSSEDINRLPLVAYDGPIHVINTPDAVDGAVHELLKEKVLGFDTETRTAFLKGEKYSPALLQLAGEQAVYVFQLSLIGFPQELRTVLTRPEIIKAGVALGRDLTELRAMGAFHPDGFEDLAHLAKDAGIPHHGLRGLAAFVLGFRISKGAQRTNWAMPRLSASQIRYAATDAWVGRQLYLKMKGAGKQADLYVNDRVGAQVKSLTA